MITMRGVDILLKKWGVRDEDERAEALLALARALDRADYSRSKKEIIAYLYRSVRNAVLKMRMRKVEHEELDEEHEIAAADSFADLEVRELIASLPSTTRAVISMLMKGYTVREISKALGLSSRAVYYHKEIAVKTLYER